MRREEKKNARCGRAEDISVTSKSMTEEKIKTCMLMRHEKYRTESG